MSEDRVYDRDELIAKGMRHLQQALSERNRWKDERIYVGWVTEKIQVLGRLVRAGATITEEDRQRIVSSPRRERVTSPSSISHVTRGQGHVKY